MQAKDDEVAENKEGQQTNEQTVKDGEQQQKTEQPKAEQTDAVIEDKQIQEVKVQTEEKQMIIRKGKILNEDGEWEDYIEESDPDRPPIAFTYMGDPGLEIEEDDEVVDFCM